MKNKTEPLETLQDIRKMMRESSRFLSLSGASGILAGLYAIAGSWMASRMLDDFQPATRNYGDVTGSLVLLGLAVLALSLITALILSGLKARKRGQRLFDHTSKRLLEAMGIPLLAGGIFCFAMLLQEEIQYWLFCPVMLIFYGLSLIAGSRHTLPEVRFLGLMELILGLTALFYSEYGLVIWALGFGVLHVIYGSIMYFKYDRTGKGGD